MQLVWAIERLSYVHCSLPGPRSQWAVIYRGILSYIRVKQRGSTMTEEITVTFS